MAGRYTLMVCVLVFISGVKGAGKPLYFESYKRPKVQVNEFPFRNTSLPWDMRVDDLVSRLSLHEIQLQMARGGAGSMGGPAPAIPRLGISAYSWDAECLRGDVNPSGNATAFPQALGLAASFNRGLIYRVANATATEVRGKHNDYVKKGVFTTHTGASCFSPVINIMRDPRWGRNQETYGEDPYLTGELAQNFVRGLQGNHKRFIRVNAGCKHFDVHGGPENIPVSRFSFDAKVSEVDWHMTFLPAFKKCVQANTYSVMCSYNRLNGVPACANKKLLTDILREEWGFTGYVVSDEGAVENIISRHHYLNNSVDTVAACVNAGCNLELSTNLADPVFMSLVQAVEESKVSEQLVRERVKPLFYTRMRLGEFDPPDLNPWASLDSGVVETPWHQALAIEAAVNSFVLLKNVDAFLPLSPKDSDVAAVLGPMTDNYGQLFGDYSATQSRSFTRTPLQGFSSVYQTVRHANACLDGTPCEKYDKSGIPSIVSGADVIFLCLGTGQVVESEARDRPDLELPGRQKDLLLDVIKYSDKTPIVLLLFSAGPLNISLAEESHMVMTIMQCFFPAQATGDALMKTMIKTANGVTSPAGRLPYTWPLLASQIPPMVNYSMAGRTYRYSYSTPLYPFGYGLSYTTFRYADFGYPQSVRANERFDFGFVVRNTGKFDSDEVIQCYASWENQSLPVPQRQLVAFDRLFLTAGNKIHFTSSISWEPLAFWEHGRWVIPAGTLNFYCGGQQPLQSKRVPSNVLSGQVKVTTTLRQRFL